MIRTRRHCMLYYPTMLSKKQLYIDWGELNVDCLWMCGDENWVPTWAMAMYTDICIFLYIYIYLQGVSRDPNELWMYSYGAPLSRVLSHLQSTDLFSLGCRATRYTVSKGTWKGIEAVFSAEKIEHFAILHFLSFFWSNERVVLLLPVAFFGSCHRFWYRCPECTDTSGFPNQQSSCACALVIADHARTRMWTLNGV